jgi:SNF2 family DNA or RNA helicase
MVRKLHYFIDITKKQAHFIKLAKKIPKIALFLGMGAYKTSVTLTAIKELKEEKKVRKVLILAPLKVANGVWKQEAEKWDHLEHLKVDICTGKQHKRLNELSTDADIHVINFENIGWLFKMMKEKQLKWKWDTLVIDESSGFKSHASLRFKILKDITPFLNRVILLTGTPSPNGYMDLWPQIYLLDRDWETR